MQLRNTAKTRNQRFQVSAKDTSRDGTNDLSMEAKLAIAEQKDKDTGKLYATVDMAIRMKAMVLLNVATEVDIANGTRGEIQDIILDEREEPSVPDEDGIIQLKYPPAMLLLKPDRTSRLMFPGFPGGIIPLTPSKAKFTVTGRSGKRFKAEMRQYSMTAGYAFTDYKSQGQTIEPSIGSIEAGHEKTREIERKRLADSAIQWILLRMS